MIKRYHIVFILSLLLLFPAAVNAQVSPEDVSKEQLDESVRAVLGLQGELEWVKIPITDKVKTSLEKKLKIKPSVPDTLFLGKAQVDGQVRYIIPDIAPSKSEKYSYVLYLNEAKEVVDVDVLEYRENYGYEIDYDYFREQFHGKKRPQEVRFQRTIQNISGATISARSLTYSVHDLLALMQKITL